MLPARSILYATHSLLARNRARQESNNPPDPDLARHFHIIPPASWKSSTAFVHWSNASRWISWFKSLIRFTKSVTEGNQVYQPSPARLPQTKASAFSFWKKNGTNTLCRRGQSSGHPLTRTTEPWLLTLREKRVYQWPPPLSSPLYEKIITGLMAHTHMK